MISNICTSCVIISVHADMLQWCTQLNAQATIRVLPYDPMHVLGTACSSIASVVIPC